MAHRAVTLVVLMVLALLLVVWMLATAGPQWNSQGLTALVVVVVLAVIGGVAFSWRRYFGKRQP